MKVLINAKLSPHKSKTTEGYLICRDAVLARTGEQEYYASELYPDWKGEDKVIKVLRRPEQVFSEETLASFENKPITCNHPDEDVDSENHNEYAVGFVRDIHRGKDDKGEDVMLGNLIITDADIVNDVENNIRTELSCGYNCDITSGDHPEQINIRGNHIALCEHGRAGNAKIIDSEPKKKLPDSEKRALQRYLGKISGRTGRDISIEEIVDLIKRKFGYDLIRQNIIGWYRTDDGYMRKDYMFSPSEYEDTSILISLYSPENYEVDEINAYITDELIQSASKKALKKNIATEIKAGKDPKQAVAIAYSVQRANDDFHGEIVDTDEDDCTSYRGYDICQLPDGDYLVELDEGPIRTESLEAAIELIDSFLERTSNMIRDYAIRKTIEDSADKYFKKELIKTLAKKKKEVKETALDDIEDDDDIDAKRLESRKAKNGMLETIEKQMKNARHQ